MTIIVATIDTAPAVLIADHADGEVLVQNGVTINSGDRILDMRFASKQQMKRIDLANATDLGDKSEEFARALIAHVSGPIKERIRQFL